jgi:hypothetical protein
MCKFNKTSISNSFMIITLSRIYCIHEKVPSGFGDLNSTLLILQAASRHDGESVSCTSHSHSLVKKKKFLSLHLSQDLPNDHCWRASPLQILHAFTASSSLLLSITAS